MRHSYLLNLVLVLVLFAVTLQVMGQTPGLPPPPENVPPVTRPTEFKIRLEFTGAKQVDLRGKEHYFSGGLDGKLVGRWSPKQMASLPVKVRFVKKAGKDLKFTSQEYAFALLNDQGEVVERELGLGFPFESDAKTGLPSKKMVREISIGDRPFVDDPQLSLWRGSDGIDDKGDSRWLPVKPGRYTLVVAIRDQIATTTFKVLGD